MQCTGLCETARTNTSTRATAINRVLVSRFFLAKQLLRQTLRRTRSLNSAPSRSPFHPPRPRVYKGNSARALLLYIASGSLLHDASRHCSAEEGRARVSAYSSGGGGGSSQKLAVSLPDLPRQPSYVILSLAENQREKGYSSKAASVGRKMKSLLARWKPRESREGQLQPVTWRM